MCRATRIGLALAFAVVCGVTASVLRAEDFRIDTDYYIGSDKTPNAMVLTIFQGGNIYDFQLKGPEVTIYEPRRGKITLLDVKRELRTTLDTADLLDAAISLQTAALQSTKPLQPIFIAAAKPEFQTDTENFSENGNSYTRLTFQSAPLQYTVVAQAARFPAAAQDFKYCADWSARLNSIRPGGLPAGARLEVNEALAAKGLIPTSIERSTPGAKLTEVRTRHLVNWKLSQDDHRRIDETGNQLARFKAVSFAEYSQQK